MALATILGGTRFRVLGFGGLVPSGCGKRHMVEDSFDHFLECYGLRDMYATGEEALDFLTTMARRARLRPPGVSKPFARYR